MKKAEMRTALTEGTTVAVIPNRYRDELHGAKRATITELDAYRKVYTGQRWDMNGHNAGDGVKVAYRAADGGVTEATLAPKDIVDTWAAYETTVAAHQDREAERLARIEAQKATCLAAVQRLGFGQVQPILSRQGFGVTGWHVTITAAHAERLTAAMNAAGYATPRVTPVS